MIVERRVDAKGNIRMVAPSGNYELTRIHPVTADCLQYGCCIHKPTEGHMSSWPYNWREDRGIMERICPHGVGHPDQDSANWFSRNGKEYENVHGCDGCCMRLVWSE